MHKAWIFIRKTAGARGENQPEMGGDLEAER